MTKFERDANGILKRYWNSLRILNILKSWNRNCVYFVGRMTKIERHTDGILQKYWNSISILIMLKAWNRNCWYFGRCMTKIDREPPRRQRPVMKSQLTCTLYKPTRTLMTASLSRKNRASHRWRQTPVMKIPSSSVLFKSTRTLCSCVTVREKSSLAWRGRSKSIEIP